MYFFHGSPRLGYLFCWRFVHNRCALTQRPACADRTAAALFSRAAVDDRPPRMTLIAEPPDLAAAAGRHLLRCKAAVARRVPLRGNDRLYRREVVEAGQNLVVGAIRTIASTPHAVSYNSRIGMSLFAAPPHAAVGAGSHQLRRQSAVFLSVPLGGKLRVLGSEVVFALYDLLSCAEWAACSTTRAG